MRQAKYRHFSVILIDGTEYQVKAASLITERYCELLAYHLVNKQHGANILPPDVAIVKGLIR